MEKKIIIFVFLISFLSMFLALPDREFYPSSVQPISDLWVFRVEELTEQEEYLLMSLSGIISRQKPEIYVYEGSGQQDIWLKEYREYYNILLHYDLQGYEGIKTMITKHISLLKGIVIYDHNDKNSLQAATSLCGIKSALGVDLSLLEKIQIDYPKIEVVGNTIKKSFSDFIDEFFNDEESNKSIVIYNDISKYFYLTQYAIMHKAFYFSGDLEGDLSEGKKVLNKLNKHAALFGWGSENDLVSVCSKNSIVVHAADWIKNLHISSGIPIKQNQNYLKLYEEPVVPVYYRFLGSPNKHTVSFLMSDGDNLQWIANGFFNSQSYFGNSKRGSIPVGWTFSSSSYEIIPEMWRYLQKNRTSNDSIISAPSGEGYLFPSEYKDYKNYVKRMRSFF